MEKLLFQDYPESKRIDMLDSNCDAIEEMHYTEPLSDNELVERKDQLAQKSIEEYILLEKKKEALAEIKAEIDPIVKQKAALLDEIKHKSKTLLSKVYKIVEGDRVGYYSPRGYQIMERSTRPDEKQLTIAHSLRTGTNNQ